MNKFVFDNAFEKFHRNNSISINENESSIKNGLISKTLNIKNPLIFTNKNNSPVTKKDVCIFIPDKNILTMRSRVG